MKPRELAADLQLSDRMLRHILKAYRRVNGGYRTANGQLPRDVVDRVVKAVHLVRSKQAPSYEEAFHRLEGRRGTTDLVRLSLWLQEIRTHTSRLPAIEDRLASLEEKLTAVLARLNRLEGARTRPEDKGQSQKVSKAPQRKVPSWFYADEEDEDGW